MPKAEEVSEEDIHPDKVDWAVETLCFSTAEQRPAVASNLRLFLTETGGVKMLWDQLCRHRKSEGAQAGLKVLVEMLQVKDDPREMAGHEPAVEILARLCNDREYSAIIGKVRKLLPSLGNVLGDLKSTRRARESASWVMRRTSEFSRVSRADLGTNREVLNLVARILKFEDLAIVPVKAGGTLGGKMARKGAEPVVSRAASPSIANIKSSPLAANNNPPSAMVTFPGVTIAEPPTRKEAEMEDPHRAPGTAGGTRPGTSMTAFGPTQVITYTSEPDSMCVEGNLCAAIGNACHQDEVLERLGKTAGLMEGIVNLLEHGSDWAVGHACRTLGNVCSLIDNCKHLAAVDITNAAPKALSNLLTSDCSKRTKLWALHAICNLSRSATLCSSFNRLDVQTGLLALSEQGFGEQDVERAIGNMCQVRLGTRTWRASKKI